MRSVEVAALLRAWSHRFRRVAHEHARPFR